MTGRTVGQMTGGCNTFAPLASLCFSLFSQVCRRPGATWDHFRCAVELLAGHIRRGQYSGAKKDSQSQKSHEQRQIIF